MFSGAVLCIPHLNRHGSPLEPGPGRHTVLLIGGNMRVQDTTFDGGVPCHSRPAHSRKQANHDKTWTLPHMYRIPGNMQFKGSLKTIARVSECLAFPRRHLRRHSVVILQTGPMSAGAGNCLLELLPRCKYCAKHTNIKQTELSRETR